MFKIDCGSVVGVLSKDLCTVIVKDCYLHSMSMDTDADPRHSCQLETRHWIVADMDHLCIEEVNGSGVVGKSVLHVRLSVIGIRLYVVW